MNFCQSLKTSCNFKKYSFLKHIDINTVIDRSSNKWNCMGGWKTRGRTPRVRSPGVWKTRSLKNTLSGGKHGVRWKTGGFSISPNYEFSSLKWEVDFHLFKFQIAMEINSASRLGMERLFDHWSKLNISWERKPFKCQHAVQWFLMLYILASWGLKWFSHTSFWKRSLLV